MYLLVKLFITGLIYALVLRLLDEFVEGFTIRSGGIISVTLILVLVDLFFGFALRALSLPIKIVTLGLLNLIINWAINVFIIWVTDKFSGNLFVSRTSALLVAGGALSLAHFFISFVRI